MVTGPTNESAAVAAAVADRRSLDKSFVPVR
jgi:hypothetical protein